MAVAASRSPAPVEAPVQAASKPVVAFAALGTLTCAYAIYSFAAWFASDHFESAPDGPDAISDGRLVALNVFQYAVFAGALVLLWRVLVRPWLRERRFDFDAKLVLACVLAWCWDPVDNYFQYTFSYNTHLVNMSSWASDMPGWQTPGQEHFAEPLFLLFGTFVVFVFGMSLFGCWVLRSVRQRFPTWSTLRLFGVVFGAIFALDFVFESIFMRTEAGNYSGTVGAFTLWAGRIYQFPIYESVFIGMFGTGLTALRWFKDDRGHTLAERGLDRLRVPARVKGFVGFLAVAGVMHAWWIGGYFVPYTYMALKADNFVALPSYLRSDMCGRGTHYACPDHREVPLARKGSIAIGPGDPRLSERVRERQAR